MELWLQLASVHTADLVETARIAEECAVTGVALADHLVYPASIDSSYPYTDDGHVGWKPTTHWPDAWVGISAMAAVTSRLRFTTAVFVAPLRDPIPLAKAISTAAVISGGRVSCGFGTGWMREEFNILDKPFTGRGERLDEMLEVLRALWDGQMVEHRGAHFSFPPVQMSPAPSTPIPVLIGGHSPSAMRRAVRNDGWIAAFTRQESALRDLQRVLRLRAQSDRAHAPFTVAFTGPGLDVSVCERLADAGATAVIVPLRALASGRSTEERKRGIRTFASQLATISD